MDNTPGWYGKLPSLGDFATRRLPTAFVSAWDAWLQRSMASVQHYLGENWLDAYLTAPLWNFVLGRNTMHEAIWAGVMLPSVDRVGRYFPLVVCAPATALVFEGNGIGALERWLDNLETVARDGLDPNTSIADFEAALASIPLPADAPALPAGAGLGAALFERPSFASFESVQLRFSTLAAHASCHLVEQLLAGHSLWWSHNAEGALGAFICDGMPDTQVFAWMMQYAPGQTS